MRHINRTFKSYLRDEGGAYAVIFVLLFGFIFLAANLGLTALKVQNPATAAEQLADIACQKIIAADPALYPTPDDVVTAALNALNSRRVRGANVTEGSFFVTYKLVDPNYVVPIKADGTNADLRRFEFTVTYSGKAYGLNKQIAPSGTADINVSKKCRPVCSGMTNIVYSNGSALGHWMNGRNLKMAQNIDENDDNIDYFESATFGRGASNPGKDNDRLVMTIYSSNANNPDESGMQIRYRAIIILPDEFYLDNDRRAVKGEPSRATRRLVVTEDDQITIQKLNADGTLPGMCGPESDAPPPCDETECVPEKFVPVLEPLFKCTFPDVPHPSEKWSSATWHYDSQNAKITFTTSNDNTPGELRVEQFKPFAHVYRIKLAPFYVPNTRTVWVRFKNGYVKMPAEVASVYNYIVPNRRFPFLLSMPNARYKRYLVHLANWNLAWWWDGANKCVKFKSPIVFDTHNLGYIKTTRQIEREPFELDPHFDFSGVGEKVQVQWPIGAGQAWLVDNRDGRAAHDMNGRRFFGDLDGHEDGYQKLRELDTSGTGVLTGRDLDGLALWFDNGNAVVEPGELKSLAEAGVTSVDTRAEWKNLENGTVALRSSAVMNGQTIMTEDIFVEISTPAVPVEAASQSVE